MKDNWCFYTLPLNVPDKSFDEFTPIINLYRSKINDQQSLKLPTWKCFNFSDFRGWHHNIALSEVDDTNYMPRFRIMPTGIVKVLDRDATGETLDTILVSATKSEIQTQIKKIMHGPLLGLTTGNLSLKDNTSVFLKSLHLPLTLDGFNVEQLIHAVSIGNGNLH